LTGSDIWKDPLGQTVFVCYREEISNLNMEMTNVMEGIKCSDGRESCCSQVASVHNKGFVVVKWGMKASNNWIS
jgi:hypothetical protein